MRIDKRTTTVKEAIQYLSSIGNVIATVGYVNDKNKRKKFIEAQELIYAAIQSLRQVIDTKHSEETGE